jgi:hypothetical protein
MDSVQYLLIRCGVTNYMEVFSMSPKKKVTKKLEKVEANNRPHYFSGEFLTAEDLEQEQQYHRPKRKVTKVKKKK